MPLTWRQVGVYLSLLGALATALIGLLHYGVEVGLGVPIEIWMVLLVEAVWYAIFCTAWNGGNGPQTWIVDWVTMLATRGVLSALMGGLITVAKGVDFAQAFQEAYYMRVALVGLQVVLVPPILYWSLFMPRLHPVVEPVAAPRGAAGPTTEAPVLPALQFNPHDPRASTLEGVLAMLSARAPNVGGLIFSGEGLPLASNLPSDLVAENLAAYGAEMLTPLQELATKMAVGKISLVTAHSDSGTIGLVPAPSLMLISVIRDQVPVMLAPEQAEQLAQALQRLWSSRYQG